MAVGSLEYSSQFDHTPFYCEENVYFLCKKLCANGVADADGSDLYAVFISNEKKQAYNNATLNWTSLYFIEKRRNYLGSTGVHVLQLHIKESLHNLVNTDPNRQQCAVFRIVHAPIFLRSFASDRRHMKDPTGNWIAEPPSYEPIVAEDTTVHNLNEYIEIGAENISTNVGAELINDVSNKKLGVVMNETQLEEFFSQVSR
ncbi:hypothetical protein Q3G72_023267 [Acer saccharum]|nr:hypothetical protein Q3G72_023267 [Acer saccharum]